MDCQLCCKRGTASPALKDMPKSPWSLAPPVRDDSLLFFRAKVEEVERIRGAMEVYANSTGQLINPRKCSIMFGVL
jgi:hypothetical protein